MWAGPPIWVIATFSIFCVRIVRVQDTPSRRRLHWRRPRCCFFFSEYGERYTFSYFSCSRGRSSEKKKKKIRGRPSAVFGTRCWLPSKRRTNFLFGLCIPFPVSFFQSATYSRCQRRNRVLFSCLSTHRCFGQSELSLWNAFAVGDISSGCSARVACAAEPLAAALLWPDFFACVQSSREPARCISQERQPRL